MRSCRAQPTQRLSFFFGVSFRQQVKNIYSSLFNQMDNPSPVILATYGGWLATRLGSSRHCSHMTRYALNGAIAYVPGDPLRNGNQGKLSQGKQSYRGTPYEPTRPEAQA